MKSGNPEGAVHGGALTTTYSTQTKTSFGAANTVESECLDCGADAFAFLGLDHGSGGKIYAVSECVRCGARRERRLPAPNERGRSA